jgi:hypothetical protein
MKNYLLLFLVCIGLNKIAYADTCPPAEGLNPYNLPIGWSLLLPPVIAGENYYFSEAIHSLNGSFYYKQIICKYAACPTSFCPAFGILSTKAYNLPNTKMPPWHSLSVIAFTFTCRPADHNPTICLFQ